MSNPDKFVAIPNDKLPVDREALRKSFIDHILHTQGKHPTAATEFDQYMSAARTARDRMADRWTRTWHRFVDQKPKRVYYLSMEFLMGRLMSDGLINLGIDEAMRKALGDVGLDLELLCEHELDPGLGNGGLGRLAACFLDSMATLGIAGMGYGIRYEFGIFRQDIVDDAQVETPDNWLRRGNPWEMVRPERTFRVHFGGRVLHYSGPSGRIESDWRDTSEVLAMAYDLPVVGHGNGVVNTLRLWSAKATRDFDIHQFNRGDYLKSVEERSYSENISRVLYPNDSTEAGQELRLRQEYFLVSATLQDAVRRHTEEKLDIRALPEHAVFQLNDTHPALAVAEMMRLLFDEHHIEWGEAWDITRRCMNYTNHTILPEALECWSVHLMERLLPRHLEIIYEINHQFLLQVRSRFPGDDDRVRRMSIIAEGEWKKVRMANLAIVGSSHVNGVSALHSKILKDQLFRDFEEMRPGTVINQTNGVTPRRWLKKCNPSLSALITEHIGSGWVTDLDQLEKLVPLADDSAFIRAWQVSKRANKERLAAKLARHDIAIDTNHLFDTQVKRIHEYKRQLLNLIHVVSLYLSYREHLPTNVAPRTFFMGGKAAPGYDMAKRIVHLANCIGRVINDDPKTRDLLRLYFVRNYNVSLAEVIIPATDVSEQISTAGTEASGTGNMKFAMNGALTIGTLDGANIEIMEAVGRENMFIFGLTAENVERTKSQGYRPMDFYETDRELRNALDAISRGDFSPKGDPGCFRPLVDKLLHHDPFLVLADYRGYALCHQTIEAAYSSQDAWTRKCILNVAHMGRFSSDNTIRSYARDIWSVPVVSRGK